MMLGGSALQRHGIRLLSLDPTNLLRAGAIRWKRKDGARFAMQVRKPTKKQRKLYNRKLQKIQAEKDKHSKPGSKAGPRREMEELEKQHLMSPPDDTPLLQGEYGSDNALLENFMGNTRHCLPNPVPKYFGDKQRFYFNKVADRMDAYHKSAKAGNEVALNNVPTDPDIANAIRAFRDVHGTRRQPVGLVKVLDHVLNDLRIPLDFLDEFSFNAILTCCQNPREARKVFQIMREQKVEIKAYSFSILVDIYAKVGDYENCGRVHDEMLANGLSPTVASYTSLMSACHKVVNDGRIPHHIRAKAAQFGWEKFQELRIIGLDADTMVYGAILRICSAIGQAEKCIGLLEEMERFNCLPTTLCFTAALKAVARSHQIAIRYEKGKSRRHRTREQITLWHGKLAREVLIMAENSGCDLDEGFISALILCAGAAGDVATAKAIYTSWQIRKLDHLRPIGTEAHLARLRGEQVEEQDALVASDGSLVEHQRYSTPQARKYQEFAEREYGKDNRVLTALLSACAAASDKSGLGTMWQGRENEGYFCINSLRLIAEPRRPRYSDHDIPGSKGTDTLTWKGEHRDEDGYRKGKRRSRKFSGVYVDENAGTSLEHLDEYYSNLYLQEDGQLRPEYRKTTAEEIWKLKYGKSYDEEMEEYEKLQAENEMKHLEAKNAELDLEGKSEFDPETKQFEGKMISHDDVVSQVKARGTFVQSGSAVEVFYSDSSSESDSEPDLDSDSDSDVEELATTAAETSPERYFNENEILWDNKKSSAPSAADESEETPLELTEYEKARLQEHKSEVEKLDGFEEFFRELKQECVISDEEPPTEEEAMDLFLLVREEHKETELQGLAESKEYQEASAVSETAEKDHRAVRIESPIAQAGPVSPPQVASESSFEDMVEDLKSKWRDDGFDLGEDDDIPPTTISSMQPDSVGQAAIPAPEFFMSETMPQAPRGPQTVTMYDSFPAQSTNEFLPGEDPADSETPSSDLLQSSPSDVTEVMESESEGDYRLEELRRYLPTFSERRLKRVLKVFRSNLGDPRMLELIPVVRETMPDYVTATWLKKMSKITSRFVMAKADEEDVVDINMLNAVLALHASAGRIDQALAFHQKEFRLRNVEPNEYSNRLVLQMFLKYKRFNRALEFKRNLEENGRTLDIKAYGSLIEYWASRNELGSAMILLRECISVHDAPPAEQSLKMLRLLSRKNNLDEKLGLKDLIGPDPLEWIREGESKRRREYSKRGNALTNHLRNVAVRTTPRSS